MKLRPGAAYPRRTTTGGIVLVVTTAIALAVATFFGAETIRGVTRRALGLSLGSQLRLEMSLHQWVNDGLMAFFLLLVGLELEREIRVGELSSLKDAALPVVAAIGGMVVPALIYAALNAGTPAASGWGIPLFISELAFRSAQLVEEAKLGILLGSAAAALIGLAWLFVVGASAIGSGLRRR
jgi:NhaA family Na+:H+ antiporter